MAVSGVSVTFEALTRRKAQSNKHMTQEQKEIIVKWKNRLTPQMVGTGKDAVYPAPFIDMIFQAIEFELAATPPPQGLAKYFSGQRVKVIDKQCGHWFKIGEIVELVEWGGINWICKNDKGDECRMIENEFTTFATFSAAPQTDAVEFINWIFDEEWRLNPHCSENKWRTVEQLNDSNYIGDGVTTEQLYQIFKQNK